MRSFLVLFFGFVSIWDIYAATAPRCDVGGVQEKFKVWCSTFPVGKPQYSGKCEPIPGGNCTVKYMNITNEACKSFFLSGNPLVVKGTCKSLEGSPGEVKCVEDATVLKNKVGNACFIALAKVPEGSKKVVGKCENYKLKCQASQSCGEGWEESFSDNCVGPKRLCQLSSNCSNQTLGGAANGMVQREFSGNPSFCAKAEYSCEQLMHDIKIPCPRSENFNEYGCYAPRGFEGAPGFETTKSQ